MFKLDLVKVIRTEAHNQGIRDDLVTALGFIQLMTRIGMITIEENGEVSPGYFFPPEEVQNARI